MPDGIRLDFPQSTIFIDGVGWPAFVATWDDPSCKPDRCPNGTCGLLASCVSGGATRPDDPAWDEGWSVYTLLPGPANVLAAIEWSPRYSDERLMLHLYGRVAVSTFTGGTGPGRKAGSAPLLLGLDVPRQCITDHAMGRTTTHAWRDCDPDWLREHLDRLTGMRVEQGRWSGKRIQIIRIGDLRVRPRGQVLA